jgi:capsular polysaccharide biosynthesis protein
VELREYIRIVVRGIWLIIPLTLLTVTITALFSYSQTPIYESNGTFVTRLDSTLSSIGDTIYGLDTLLGRQRIFVTYCDVMSSDSTINNALQLLGISPSDIAIGKDYTVVCSPVPESNVLVLTVRGTSPLVVERLNEAIGQVGIERVNSLYNFFPVEVLDTVELVEGPVAPNHTTNLVLGGALGLILSVSLAFLLDYLRSPQNDFEALSIRDADFAVYKDRYFQRRLQEEFERAKTSYRTLSIAFVKLIVSEDFEILPEKIQKELMRRIALDMQNYQPQSNIVAYRGQTTFEVLIPERSGAQARSEVQDMVDSFHSKIYRHESYNTRFDIQAIVVESDGADGILGLQQQGLKALEEMDWRNRNNVLSVSTLAKPFGDNEFTLQTGEHEAFIFSDEEGIDLHHAATQPIPYLGENGLKMSTSEDLKTAIKRRNISRQIDSEGTNSDKE